MWIFTTAAAAELVAERRVTPTYPKGERVSEAVRCVVTARIDTAGVPYEATVEGCPAAFAEAARAATMQWRWQPVVDEAGTPVNVQATLAFDFQPPAPPLGSTFVGLGALYAPDDPSPQDPADLAFLMRAHVFAPGALGTPEWFALGVDIDLRGFRTYAAQAEFEAGVVPISNQRGSIGVLTGFGWTQRGVGDPWVVFSVPARLHLQWAPSQSFALNARGGVDLALVTVDALRPAPAPTAVFGATVGDAELGIRVEAGWRREFDADTWTLVAGFAL